MKDKLFLIVLAFIYTSASFAQDSSGGLNEWNGKPTVHVSGFMDIYYMYDANKPGTGFRQPFLYNHNRHNEFNLNLGYLKLGVEHPKYRANLALQTGTYPNDNYVSEPGLLKGIFESNIGVSLNKGNSLWLDAGIFSSHIGFESAVSIDSWTLTRSILAENSPYYLAGAKLTYSPDRRWELAALVCNGWQRIAKVPGQSLPSFGTQIKFTPSGRATLNWSTFVGTDDPDLTRRMRYFSNVYGQFQFNDKLGLIAGWDFGLQQTSTGSSIYQDWFSFVLIGRYMMNNRFTVAGRVEYYQDEAGIIIPTGTMNGFQTAGFSLNLDYQPIQHIVCRLEGRWLHSVDDIFHTESGFTNNNFVVGSSIAIKMSQVFKLLVVQ
ncbi:MAG: porin [Saprospiraceae bacterium]|nr:porin [Saprospiraceae bacterium]